MGWRPYDLDHLAVEIVLKAKQRDEKAGTDSRTQAHKMRAACAYGLERFWGESRRLASDEPNKAKFIADVWKGLAGVLATAGVSIPSDLLSQDGRAAEASTIINQLWGLSLYEQSVALAVLTNLCDSVVWWSQRLMRPSKETDN